LINLIFSSRKLSSLLKGADLPVAAARNWGNFERFSVISSERWPTVRNNVLPHMFNSTGSLTGRRRIRLLKKNSLVQDCTTISIIFIRMPLYLLIALSGDHFLSFFSNRFLLSPLISFAAPRKAWFRSLSGQNL